VIYDICLSLYDLFHPVWQSLGPSMLLQITSFCSFCSWVIFHCIHTPHFLYSFLSWWTFRLLPRPGYYKQCWVTREATELLYDPAIPLLSLYSEKTIIQKDTCIPVFITALFIVARTWKQSKCPSREEWIKKMWCLETSMGRRAWWAIVHGVTKHWKQLSTPEHWA